MYLSYNTFSNTHTPAVETLATMNVETGPKIQKHRSGQIIHKDVHQLGGRRDMQDADITDGNTFPNKVEVYLDMFCMLVLNGIGGEVDGTDIITVELLEELLEPTSFGHAIGHDAILSLGARSGDDVLPLGGPVDKVVAEEHSVTRGGPVCIRATRPVRIRVNH
jgi:hypothetical protein